MDIIGNRYRISGRIKDIYSVSTEYRKQKETGYQARLADIIFPNGGSKKSSSTSGPTNTWGRGIRAVTLRKKNPLKH